MGVASVIRRVRRQGWHGCALLLWAAAWVVLVRLGLWVLPFRSVWRLVDRLGRVRGPRRLAGAPAPERVRLAVWAVSRRLPACTCLPRALALHGLLAQLGYASTVRVGAARTPAGGFSAHAWVERDGAPLEPAEGLWDFAPFPELPRAMIGRSDERSLDYR
jgi:hypothetical protein